MLKIITVILMLFEKCLKYITKNAYIMIAMQGHAFCDAACHGFKLLLTNLVQFVLVSCFSKVVIFLGKVTIMGTAVVSAYFWLAKDPAFKEWTPSSADEEWDGITGRSVVNNKFLPLVLIGVLGYFCAAAFLHVYDLAIATILLCFCEDYKVHQVGDPHFPDLHKEVYMPNSLRRIVLTADEFHHMQHPLTTEELMNMAGVDIRSDAEKEILSYDEVIEFCKKLLVQSDEFPHLHKHEDDLTEKEIIDETGGPELWQEIRRPNPLYDKQFALDLSAGRVAVKKGYHDKRLDKYTPELTATTLAELIERAGIMHRHAKPLTQEDLVAKATEIHGHEYAQQLNDTPSRTKVKKRLERRETRRKMKGNKVNPTEETPVSDATAELKKENAKPPSTHVSEEAMF